MTAKVEIPSALQKFVKDQPVVEVPAGTVKNVFSGLISEYGELKNHLYDENGQIRSFINIYLNDEDIRYAENLDTEVKAGDVLQIVPSIAGGR
jgi:molybdopterin converting factor small subunit